MNDDIYYGIIDVNQRVTGIVTKIEDTRAIVDIGAPYKGYLYFPELPTEYTLSELINIGDELDLIVEKINEYGGTVHLRPTSRCNQHLKAKFVKLQNKKQKSQSVITKNNDSTLNEIMSQVQEKLTQMKPSLISEVAISVYSQLEKELATENAELKSKLSELEQRIKQLESLVDKIKL